MKQKVKAAGFVCQSKADAMEAISVLGDTQRSLIRAETMMNDEIAAITSREKELIDALQRRIDILTSGIHGWCEANRADLLKNGGKSANLITGEVSWRQRPPSISIRGVDKVIETLKALKLTRFLREKIEPNKEAMLADPKAVSGISGISIVTGVEDFAVVPFEVEVVS